MGKQNKVSIILKALLLMCCMGVLLLRPVSVEAATKSLNTTKLSIEETKTYTLKVENAQESDKIKFSSVDSSIAKVSSKGVVTGVSAGKTTINVKVTDKNKKVKTYKCAVNVKPLYVPTISQVELIQDGDMVLDQNAKVGVSFVIDKKVDAVVCVYNSSDEMVCKKKKSVNKNKKATFYWDGKENSGEDNYYFVISADTAEAKSDYFYVYETIDFEKGTGSKKNPYAIADIEQFKKIVLHNGCNFYLTKDIDLEYGALESLFSNDQPFKGSLDGKGHSIRNVMNTTCMFNAVGETGSIKNLVIDGLVLNVSASNAMFVNYNYGNIEEVSLLNVSTGGEYGKAGICWENNGTIKKCAITGSLTASITSKGSRTGDLGGIAAVNTSTGKILACAVDVDMKYSCPDRWEHRAGMIVATNSGLISNTAVAGSFDAPNWKNYWCTAGTLVGVNAGTIQNCASIGTTNCDDIGSNSGTVN